MDRAPDSGLDQPVAPQQDHRRRSGQPGQLAAGVHAARRPLRLRRLQLRRGHLLPGQGPGLYWQHFAAFFLVALVVTLLANHFFGLYGRMWRHAGVEEARQLILSAAVVVCVLVVVYPLGRPYGFEHVPITVIVVGCMFATLGMGVLRFHSRLFAWQRGSTPGRPAGGRGGQSGRRRRRHPRDAAQPGGGTGAGGRVR